MRLAVELPLAIDGPEVGSDEIVLELDVRQVVRDHLDGAVGNESVRPDILQANDHQRGYRALERRDNHLKRAI